MTKAIPILFMVMMPWVTSNSAQIPKSYAQDTRVKHVVFEDNNVVSVDASTFTSTQIVFSKHESILDVEGGDTSSWIVTHHNNLPNMMFIKPTTLASNTNMTVVTNKHTYYFHLLSNKELKSDAVSTLYAIKFVYPAEEQAIWKAKQKEASLKNSKPKNPKTLNWNYHFSGNSQIMPAHVYDDGTFTYLELQKNQPVPAIFAVDDHQGKEAIVNTRRQGNVLVIQRLAPQFTLRHGGLVASVFNSNEIARLKQGRR
ncbi:P-type conjugative transfer protein VirB9 [Legionella longbeachae]|uniref:P-type conjugative transfer protein VirB9 n=1 Tax=Legionella longbeachae TaxID=450 RepID=UPI0001BEBC91|nr:P-type conjugative transfer protein VirB9 [Legionella longbeachae]EEZ95947.1 Legionella vir-like protein LvhB9 [Legionella longbeachae D-4968]